MPTDAILSMTAAAVVFGSFLIAINWRPVRAASLRFLDTADRFGASLRWLGTPE
jgi:hypothetical protein